jgi:hypothetical protein
MATVSPHPMKKTQISPIVIAATILIALAVVIGIGYHALIPATPSLSQQLDLDKHPIPAWVTQDARQCQGDINKLSPQEQQKIAASYPGQGGRIIVMAAYAQSH